MGAGASVETERERIQTLFPEKPADGSDIKDFESAMAEIIQTRKAIKQLQSRLRDADTALNVHASAHGEGKAKRAAVMDRGLDKVNIGTDFVPKVFTKPESIATLLRGIVSSNILFSSYSSEEQASIVAAFESTIAPAGSFVIRQDTEGDIFYVVESGSLDVYVKNTEGVDMKVGNPLGTGNWFGELALMYNTPRAASIKAASECKLWKIDRDTYRGIILHSKFIRNRQYIDFLKKVEINGKNLGSLMNDKSLEQVVALLQREIHEMGEVIVRQGNVGDNFYIIASGEVSVRKTIADKAEELVAVLKTGDYFGEQALLRDDVRQATCYATTKVITLTLGREDFINLMGTMEELLALSGANRSARASPTNNNTDNVTSNSTNNNDNSKQLHETVSVSAIIPKVYTLESFTLGRTLGCGAFGRVKVCKLTETNTSYAIKCQSKLQIVNNKLQTHIINEVHIMRMMDHPFIIKLFATFQDNKYIYFVTELLHGGELFTYLRDSKRIPEQSARFYAASVINAYQALHGKSVAYRDLKPENIVMSNTGYVKLIDLGLAKQILGGKTYTLCGTPDYLAPEVILNEGHDIAVDYWALGVLIYEMVVGLPPFYAKDPIEVYEKILTGEVRMHSSLSPNLGDLLKKLLTLKQSKRLGVGRNGVSTVMKQKWFSSFDWARLQDLTMIAPYVPVLSSPDDVSHFDQFDEAADPQNCEWYPEGI